MIVRPSVLPHIKYQKLLKSRNKLAKIDKNFSNYFIEVISHILLQLHSAITSYRESSSFQSGMSLYVVRVLTFLFPLLSLAFIINDLRMELNLLTSLVFKSLFLYICEYICLNKLQHYNTFAQNTQLELASN